MREEKMPDPGWSLARAWARAGLAVAFTLVLIASLTSASWARAQYKTLHRFTYGGRGANTPLAGLVADLHGNLYGTTLGGGAFGYGTVFELAPDGRGGWRETVLHSFNHTDGDESHAVLIFDGVGNLYGTTRYGGAFGRGTVFKLAPNSHGGWKETVLYSFTRTEQIEPFGSLIFDSAGNLYGTTEGDTEAGAVFELAPHGRGGWKEVVLHTFNSFNHMDGANPYAGLIFDSAGNLYGTTRLGGTRSGGTVFELSPDGHGGWTETILYSFNDTDGWGPTSTVIFDAAGNLYGTTSFGGVHNAGTVFELSPDGHGGWNETVLHSFNLTDGRNPVAGLVFDATGNLYGTTVEGGAFDWGTVFELTPNGHGRWKEKVLHSFLDRPGAYPPGGLIFGGQGHLYGTTSGDQTTTFGSVFEITP